MVFPVSCVAIFINMLLIIHSVLMQVQRSDRWQLRSGTDGTTTCGSRLAGYFLSCVSTCCGIVKKCMSRLKNITNNNGTAELSKKNEDSSALRPNALKRAAGNLPHTDHLPSSCTCLEPVEIRARVSLHETTHGIGDNEEKRVISLAPSKHRGIGEDEENGLSLGGGSEPRAPPLRSGTSAKPYEFNAAKARAAIGRELLIKASSPSTTQDEEEEINNGNKPRAPPSRSGTSANPYEFNAAKVRASIRRESLIRPSSPVITQEEEATEDNKPTAPPYRSGTSANSYEFKDARSSTLIRRESSGRALDDGEPSGFDDINDLQPVAGGSRFRQHSNLLRLSYESKDVATGSEEDNENNENNENNNPSNSRVDKEVIAQALLYMSCFFLTYIFTIIVNVAKIQGKEAPFTLQLLARLTLPMQGIFNILAYTRPHIVSLRRRNPEYSWWKAFVVVFKAGGDNDSVGQNQRSGQQPASNEDIRRRQELIERDFNRRMTDIRRRSTVSPELIASARLARIAAEEERRIRITEMEKKEHDKDGSENIEIYGPDEELGTDIAKCSHDDEINTVLCDVNVLQ